MSTSAESPRGVAHRALTIRRATREDGAALAEFGARVFTATFGPENDPRDMAAYLESAYGTELQRAEIAGAGNVFLLAIVDDALAGYVFLRDAPLNVSAVASDRAREIARLYVDTRWQGAGVAAKLMEAAVADARDRGAPVIWLGVWERNPRAIRFYEKHGFRDVGDHEFRLGSDVQRDRLMARRLPGNDAEGRGG